MLLADKTVLVTGVLTEQSIAWSVAREAQELGAEVLLTAYGRTRRPAERAARSLPRTPAVLELDVTREEDFAALPAAVAVHAPRLHGVLHAVAWGAGGLREGMFGGTRDDVARMVDVTAFSYRRLTETLVPLLDGGGSVVGLTFSPGVAYPGYDWMGVGKAALEAVNRALAGHLGPRGIRTNLVASGPVRSVASEAFERFDVLCDAWEAQAPLGWDSDDPAPVARAVCLLWSDLAAGISGSVVHADGGAHALARPMADGFGAPEPARPGGGAA